MRIVIDIGCARYGGDYSIERLIERFDPDVLYGFDPSWEDGMYVPAPGVRTSVVCSNEAAWTHQGTVRFLEDGLNGQIGVAEHWPLVPCFDLAHFIRRFSSAEIILKLDCEGAEVPLLKHLHDRRADERLSLALVEWHCLNCRKGGGIHSTDCPEPSVPKVDLRCPIEEWLW